MRFGYWNGYLAGQRAERERYERENQRLTEQLADARRAEEQQRDRADRAIDLLVKQMGMQPISESAAKESLARALANTRPARAALPLSPFEDLPIGHPDGTYMSPEEAELRPEDVQ